MARSFKHSVLAEFLQSNGALDNISRDDFDSDEEYEQCLHELVEGSKVILMENDGDLGRSMEYLSDVDEKTRRSVKEASKSVKGFRLDLE